MTKIIVRVPQKGKTYFISKEDIVQAVFSKEDQKLVYYIRNDPQPFHMEGPEAAIVAGELENLGDAIIVTGELLDTTKNENATYVRVDKASSEGYWYAPYIGEKFEVVDETGDSFGKIYEVINPYDENVGGYHLIREEDCTIIEPRRKDEEE